MVEYNIHFQAALGGAWWVWADAGGCPQPPAPARCVAFALLAAVLAYWSVPTRADKNRAPAGGGALRTLPALEVYDIKAALTNEIIGGACTLTVEVGHTNAFEYPFFIRGKNPLDATARAYITANVDVEFQPYAWMVAKHETKDGSRVYNQFNARGDKKELPNWGSPYGWGIGQIDKDRNGDTTAEVYDWHENVSAMNETLRAKLAEYRQFIRWYREVYQNDTSTRWFEPDGVTTNIEGYVVSAEMWGVLNCYNGKGGIPGQNIGTHVGQRSPLQFDPASTNWIFHTNANDYVPKVIHDRNQPEQE